MSTLTKAVGDTASTIGAIAAFISVCAIIVSPFAAWLTHIVVCLQTGNWGFLIAGALFFPIGLVHGVGHWFGAW